jgi:Domain of unknown function (DUF4157)/Novel toxin 15
MEATLARKKKDEPKPARKPHEAEPAHEAAPEPEHAPAAGVPLFLRRAPASSAPAALAALGDVAVAPADDALEREAEAVADAVASRAPAAPSAAPASAPVPAPDAAPLYKTYKNEAAAESTGPASGVPAFLRGAPSVSGTGLGAGDEEQEPDPSAQAGPGTARAASGAALPPPDGDAYKAYRNPPAPGPSPYASTTPAYLRRAAAPSAAPEGSPRAEAAHLPPPRFLAGLPGSLGAAGDGALGVEETPEARPPDPLLTAAAAAAAGAPGGSGGSGGSGGAGSDGDAGADDPGPPLALDAEAGAAGGSAGGGAGGERGDDEGTDRSWVVMDGLRELLASAFTFAPVPDASVSPTRTDALPHARASSPGDPLADGIRILLESILGADLSGVRVHKQPEDRALARELDARAFALGGDIWLGPGESDQDLKLMAHEVAHVLQGDPLLRRAPAGSKSKPKKEPAKKKAGDAGGSSAAGGAPSASADAAPAAAAGGGDAVPAPLLMPEPPSDLSRDDRARIGEVREQSAQAADAQADMPPAGEVTDGTRAAVAEPAAEAAGRAQGELVEGLDEKVKPSPEIEELCKKIRDVIRKKRPPDEDKLVEAKPEEMAKQAGGELDGSIQGDTKKVQGGYDEMGQTPSGVPAPAEQPLETLPAGTDSPAVHATAAVPGAVPAEKVSLDADVASSAQKMDDAGMNKEPAQLVETGPIADARAAQGELVAKAAEDPAKVIARQEEARGKASADMAALQAKALAALRGARKDTAGGVGTQQGKMVKDEAVTRENVGKKAETIFKKAQDDVRGLLTPLPTTAMERWNTEKAVLSREFKDSLAKVKKWIDERHEGVGGAILAGADYLFGLPAWVTLEYDTAEKKFGDGVTRVIREISIEVNRVVLICEKIVEQANRDIKALYDKLPAELQAWAEGERARFGEQLDGLKDEARKTRDAFNKDLVQRAGEAVQEVRQEIHKLRQEAGGLVGKVLAAVDAFLEDPAKFIIEGLLQLLGIEPSSFWALINKISQVIDDIADNPMSFANNLMAGLAAGFTRFFDNIGKHLVAGFFDWLFSGLGSVGVQLPKDFSLKSIIVFALQLMGITWARIRKLLAKHIGEKNVAILEKAYEMVALLIEKGPEGILEMIKEKLDPKTIIDAIIKAGIEFLVEALVKNVSARIVMLFNPAGAIVQALEAIYRVLKWVFENAARIFSLVETVVNGIADVIAGNIGGMAKAVEKGLAMLIAPVIDFLADYIGLGDLPLKIADVIKGFQEWVEGILDTVIGFLATRAKELLKALGLGGKDKPAGAGEGDGEIGETVRFSAGGEGHRMWVQTSGTNATLMVASSPEDVQQKIAHWNGKVDTLPEKGAEGKEPRKEAKALLGEAGALANEANKDADELAKIIAKHAAPAAGAAEGKDSGKSEVDAKDNALEGREHALATVIGKLFDLFGGGGVEFKAVPATATLSGGTADVLIDASGNRLRLMVDGAAGLARLSAVAGGALAEAHGKSGLTAARQTIKEIEVFLPKIEEVMLLGGKIEANALEEVRGWANEIAASVGRLGATLEVGSLVRAVEAEQMQPAIKPNPSFEYPKTPSEDYRTVFTNELLRQLGQQQAALNKVTVDKWTVNVNAFRMEEADFDAMDVGARRAVLARLQTRAREAYDNAFAAKQAKYDEALEAIEAALKSEDVPVPDRASIGVLLSRFGDQTTPWRAKHIEGIKVLYDRAVREDAQFATICSEVMKFVVLHDPDQIAGGPEKITEIPLPPPASTRTPAQWEKYLADLKPMLGSRRVNSAIGRQWSVRIQNVYDSVSGAHKKEAWGLWILNLDLMDVREYQSK